MMHKICFLIIILYLQIAIASVKNSNLFHFFPAPLVVDKEDAKCLQKKFDFLKNKYLCYVILGVVFILIIMGIYLIVSSLNKNQNAPAPNFTPTERPTSKLPMVYKHDWKGLPASGYKLLAPPTPLVIIKHTAGGFTTDSQTCRTKVRDIQAADIGNKYPDIRYNFLICGDGKVYVGRDWGVENQQRPNSIDIAFMGSFDGNVLSPEMIAVCQELINEGVRNGYLSKDYKLVGHQQTMGTASPGKNIMEVIRKWPHYYSGSI